MQTIKKYTIVLLLLLWIGCLPRTTPEVALKPYNQIGLLDFTIENASGNIDEVITVAFRAAVEKVQSRKHLKRLGARGILLKKIDKKELDSDAVKIIGQRNALDALFVGMLSVSNVAPMVELSGIASSVKVRARMDLSLTARLISTSTGENIWTNTVSRWQQDVQYINVRQKKHPRFEARKPEAAYGELIYEMVYELTRDFREARKASDK